MSEIGHPIGQPFGLVAAGFFESEEDIDNWYDQSLLGGRPIPGDVKYKDINGDNIIDSNDQCAIGYTREPELVFGFGGTIEYKGFDLSAYFTGAARTSTFFEDRTFWPFASGMGFSMYSRKFMTIVGHLKLLVQQNIRWLRMALMYKVCGGRRFGRKMLVICV